MDPLNAGSKILKNVGDYLPVNRVSYRRRLESINKFLTVLVRLLLSSFYREAVELLNTIVLLRMVGLESKPSAQ